MDEVSGDARQGNTATFSSGDGAVIHIHNSNIHLGAGGNVKFADKTDMRQTESDTHKGKRQNSVAQPEKTDKDKTSENTDQKMPVNTEKILKGKETVGENVKRISQVFDRLKAFGSAWGSSHKSEQPKHQQSQRTNRAKYEDKESSFEPRKVKSQQDYEHIKDEKPDVGQTKPDRVARHKGKEQNSVTEQDKNDTDLWLVEGMIVLYKNRSLTKSSKNVFYGRQQILSKHWRDVAIKLVESNEKNCRELSLLCKLHHPNIVQIFDVGERQTEMMSYLFIVMELCDQNLRDYVNENPFNFEVSFSFSKQLAAGLAFLHENQVPHGNLKPDNVLVSFGKKTVKLSADFGLSKEIPSGQSAASVTCTGLGLEGFRSPETYQSNTRVSLSVDIFPYGLVTYFTFTKGKHPYGTDPNEQSYNIMENQNRDLSLIPEFDKPNGHKRVQLLDLLSRTLQHSPRDRPTAKDIERHTFFTDTN